MRKYWIRLALFIALTALLASRFLFSETFTNTQFGFVEQVIQAGAVDVGGPTPGTTAWIDLRLIVLSGVALALLPRPRLVTLAPFLLLTAGVLLSTFAADNRRLALNVGVDMLATVIAGAALAGLIRAEWMRRIVIGAVVASAAVSALKCVSQEFGEFQDVREAFLQRKAELFAQGAPGLDSPEAVNYERRLMAMEAFGYVAHPNVAAAGMALGLLLALGATVALVSRRAPASRAVERFSIAALLIAIAALLAVGVWFTGSRGAMLAALIAIVAATPLLFFDQFAARKRRAVLLTGIGVYAGVIAIGVGWGLARGGLPGASLNFRWQYWTAATSVYAERPLTGVGRENFAAPYLRYRDIDATEEIRNPHNLWLTLLVENGPLGLIGGAWLLVLVLWRGAPQPRDALEAPDRAIAATPRWALVAMPIVLAGAHALFSETPLGAPGVGLLWLFEIVLAWALVLLIVVVALDVGGAPAARLISVAALGALVALVTHGLISVAPTMPGVLSLAALVGAALCARVNAASGLAGKTAAGLTGAGDAGLPPADGGESADTGAGRLSWPILIGTGVVGLAVYGAVVQPAVCVDRAFADFRAAVAARDGRFIESLLADPVVDCDEWNPAPQMTYARWLAGAAGAPGMERPDTFAEAAEIAAREAIARGESGPGPWMVIARLRETLAERHADDIRRRELREALAAWREAAARHPTDTRVRANCGLLAARIANETGQAEMSDLARDELRRAIEIDERRSPRDAQRLSPEARQEIETILRSL